MQSVALMLAYNLNHARISPLVFQNSHLFAEMRPKQYSHGVIPARQVPRTPPDNLTNSYYCW